MTNRYEVVYIFDSALEEAQVNEHLERFHALLKTPETPEPVRQVNHWGKRTLAYPIKRREVGYYVVVQFETLAQQLAEFERLIKLDESVIRHLVVIDEGATPAVVRPAPEEEPENEVAVPPEEAEE
ncbi:MAG: 30S ribosomal protein S6 [Gemmatimonadetes bacterium]|nr:30S ribosomal protein S6 [Gemmatimonadota bacterium]MBI2535782.1 30S ribosomal protein S6 [Gemmatimonadota bacterium]